MFSRQILPKLRFLYLRQFAENRQLQNVVNFDSLTCNNQIAQLSTLNVINKTAPIFVRKSHQRSAVKRSYKNSFQENDEDSVSQFIHLGKERLSHHAYIAKIPGYDNVAKLPETKAVDDEVAKKLLQENWIVMTNEELLSNFSIICSYIEQHINESEELNYDLVFQAIMDRLFTLTKEDLKTILLHYQKIKLLNNKAINLDFRKAIDKELLSRLMEFSVDENLQFCDLLTVAHLSKACLAFLKMMRRISQKTKRLTRQQMIHYMYLLTSNRSCPATLYELEYYVEKFLKEICMEEVTILAIFFFMRKYQPTNSDIINTLLDRTLENKDHVDTYQITAIMKFLRSYRHKDISVKLSQLFDAIAEKLDNYDMFALTHVAHAGANNTLRKDNILDKVIQRIMEHPTSLRLKDYERVAFVLGNLNVLNSSHPIFPLIIKQIDDPLHRKDELKNYRFTKAIYRTCMFLCRTGYYNVPMLKKIMEPEFQISIYETMLYNINLENLWLDQSLEIELPEFTFPRLEPKVLQRYIAFFKTKLPHEKRSLSSYDRYVMEIVDKAKQILGEDSVTLNQILPHFDRYDIVIAIDKKQNKILPVESMISDASGIKYIPEQYKDNVDWFVLIPGTEYCCVNYGTEPIGLYQTKMRQLKRIGYTPLFVNNKNWTATPSLRRKYLESLLYGGENTRIPIKNELFIEQ